MVCHIYRLIIHHSFYSFVMACRGILVLGSDFSPKIIVSPKREVTYGANVLSHSFVPSACPQCINNSHPVVNGSEKKRIQLKKGNFSPQP
jgi:hypothetical protein